MSNQQKRGFRLPWANDHGPDEGGAAATVESDSPDNTPAAVSDEPGAGSSAAADTPPTMTKGAVPAASDVPVSPEAKMIDADQAAKERIERAMSGGAWPTTDWKSPKANDAPTRSDEPVALDDRSSETSSFETPSYETASFDAPSFDSSQAEASTPTTSYSDAEARAPRRENPIVAGLVKAMREAALASRAETTSRLAAEATARVESIRAEATTQSAELRKRVDEDISKIREWSKGEMARIRAETEGRIETRRAEAIHETQTHSDAVEHLVEQVQGQVKAYEADMDRFFDRLLAENDPAQLATLAEQAPEPPDLSATLPALGSSEWDDLTWSSDMSAAMTAETDAAEATPENVAADESAEASESAAAEMTAETSAEATAETTAESTAEPLEAAAAAEAEAEATEGLEMPADNAWPAAVLAAARRNDEPPSHPEDDAGHSRLVVSGLTSVAGISAFKGAIGQLPGVRSVSVTSGERGQFIFNVSHEPSTDIAEAVTGLTSFAVRITEATGDSVSVTANEPAA